MAVVERFKTRVDVWIFFVLLVAVSGGSTVLKEITKYDLAKSQRNENAFFSLSPLGCKAVKQP